MNTRQTRFLRIFAVAVFLGFQTVQSFHKHNSATTDDNCAVCQVVHHTPSTSAPAAASITTVFSYQPVLSVASTPAVALVTVETVRPRAPPAA